MIQDLPGMLDVLLLSAPHNGTKAYPINLPQVFSHQKLFKMQVSTRQQCNEMLLCEQSQNLHGHWAERPSFPSRIQRLQVHLPAGSTSPRFPIPVRRRDHFSRGLVCCPPLETFEHREGWWYRHSEWGTRGHTSSVIQKAGSCWVFGRVHTFVHSICTLAVRPHLLSEGSDG